MEIINFYWQKKLYKTVSNTRGDVIESRLSDKINFLENLCYYDPYPFETLKDFYYGYLEWDEINKNDLVNNLCLTINNFRQSRITNQDKKIIYKSLSYLENKFQKKLCTNNTKNNKSINLRTKKLNVWYKPFLIIIFMFIIRYFYNFRFWLNNFNKKELKNGIVFRYKMGNKNYTPTVFFHCSIGGAMPYLNFLNKFKGTIISVEIPGISFQNYVYHPPSLDKIVLETIRFINLNNFNKFNLIGHSFGCFLANRIINSDQNYRLKNVYLIEGVIYTPRVLKTYQQFHCCDYILLKQIHFWDFIYIFFFQRDLYCQFYLNREVNIRNGILKGVSRIEKRKRGLNIILSKNDEKIDTKCYLKYAKNKKIKYNHYVIDGLHGSFIFDVNCQNLIVDNINNY